MTKLMDIEGVGETYAKKLAAAGVRGTAGLLKSGATPQGRKLLSDKTGIAESLILQWVNHVDLYRIKGVGSEYSDLLEAAGVDTVVELANRNPANLFQKLVETNRQEELVRQLPVESQVAGWVEQAKKLERKITY
jgi:predicted flap endonuclease-1-like 5' DNA nuclease